MNRNLRVSGIIAFGALALGACATKGFVRDRLGEERVARTAADSSIMTDVSGVRTDLNGVKSEVATVKNDVAGLRNDLQALRTEFGAKITAMEEGLKFAFPVNFAFDDATVREPDKAALDRFASVIQKYYGGSHITIEGFADPAGGNHYNMTLSKRRADAVGQYLSEKGLSGMSLRTVGYGSTRQVNQGAKKDDPGAEQNRRVVFVVESRGDKSVAMNQQ
jgi:peptidoglycan-associated lipoprotein